MSDSSIGGGHRLHRLASSAAIVTGIGVTGLNLLHSNAYLLLLGPCLLTAGLIHLAPETGPSPEGRPVSPASIAPSIAHPFFWLLLGAAALLGHAATTQRPVTFFILAAVAAALLPLTLGRAISMRASLLYLCGAIALSLVLRTSVFFLTPGLPGSDAWGHAQLTGTLIAYGHIPSTWSSPYYLHYPAFHLLTAMATVVPGLSSRMALFLGAGIPLALSGLCIFVTARRLCGCLVACIAALLVLCCSYHLQWGTQIIPTSMGLSLFTLAVMLALGINRPPPATAALSLLTVLALVLCHTVSSFILWLALLALLLGTPVLRRLVPAEDSRLPLRNLLVLLLPLTVLMFARWGTSPYTPAGDSFLERILLTLRDSVTRDAAFLDRPAEAAPADELLAVSGFALYYFLAAMGSLRALGRSSRSPTALHSVTLAVALLTGFVFLFPVFGLRNILPHRWFAFIWVLAAPLAALGLCDVLSRCRSRTTSTLLGAGVVALLTFLMVTSPVSNTDNPLYANRITQRLTYYESELQAAEWLSACAAGPYSSDLQFGGRVMGDHHSLTPVYAGALDLDSLRRGYYVWRSTGLTHPVQLASGSLAIPGTGHALEVESAVPALYATRHAIVYGPAAPGHVPEGRGAA